MKRLAAVYAAVFAVGCSSSGDGGSSSSSSGGNAGASSSSSSSGGSSSSNAASSSGGGSSSVDCDVVPTPASSSGGSSSSAPPPQWGCVGRTCWATPATQTIDQLFVVKDFISGDVLTGMTVKGCPRTDETCANALVSGTSDAQGRVTLTLPMTPGLGFDGFLEVTGSTIVPTYYYLYPYLVAGGATYSLPIIAPNTQGIFALALGTQVDPTKGHLGLSFRDCAGNQAPGVQFTSNLSDAGTIRNYIISRFPSATATATDADGVGGFVNVPPGTATITANLTGQTQVMATANAFVRAGYITFVNLLPSP